MPGLDVSFVTSDPMLADTFTVQRNAETIGTNGRTQIATTTIANVVGVVTQEDPADLVRSESGQSVPRLIEINSTFQFRDAVQGYQPDVVLWNGGRYMVKKIYPYSHFGSGHSRAVLESTDGTDPPLTS